MLAFFFLFDILVELMTTEEKLLQALEHLQADVNDLKHGQVLTNTSLAQVRTVLKVLEAGQNDIRENMATKADVQDSKAEQTKLKRRIENLEEHTKTPNPHKN